MLLLVSVAVAVIFLFVSSSRGAPLRIFFFSFQDFRVRLKGSPLSYKGRIEIEIGGIWGNVDDNGWDIYDKHSCLQTVGIRRRGRGVLGRYLRKWVRDQFGCRVSNAKVTKQAFLAVKHRRLQAFNSSHDDRRDASVECYGR